MPDITNRVRRHATHTGHAILNCTLDYDPETDRQYNPQRGMSGIR